MDPERLIGALLEGAVGKRGRKGRGALKYLTGGGRSSFINAGTLLTAAGLAWGVYEAATRKGEAAAPPSGAGPFPPGAGPFPPAGGPFPPGAAGTVPPPLPGAAGMSAVPPPLPGAQPASAATAFPPDMLRLVRLTIAAARVDGRLTDEERQAILGQARAAGAEGIVQQEIQNPRPLAEIVAGVTDQDMKEQLYVLAFAVVRTDEAVSGAERIFLAQLAHALGLDPATTARLESEAGARIDAAATEQEG